MSLQYAILGILTYAPMNGYNLKKFFDSSINNFWSANLSQIYRELSTLEEKEYVSSEILAQEDRPDKRIYSITEEGRNAFGKWLSSFSEILLSPKRDEFMLKIFFGSKMDKDLMISQFMKFIEQREKDRRQVTELKRQLDNLVQGREIEGWPLKLASTFKDNSGDFSIENEALYWSFTLKRAVMTLEALERWAHECIEEINSQKANQS